MKAENLAIDAIRGSSLFSLADNPHLMEFNLFKTLDGLINGWCDSQQRNRIREVLLKSANLYLPRIHKFFYDQPQIDVCGLLGPTVSRGRPAW
jgi:hypothetical protein